MQLVIYGIVIYQTSKKENVVRSIDKYYQKWFEIDQNNKDKIAMMYVNEIFGNNNDINHHMMKERICVRVNELKQEYNFMDLEY